MTFQTRVNLKQPPAVAGDFASQNPRAVMLAGPGIFKAPAGGVRVGYFCWANPDTGAVSQTYVAGYQLGFLHRENQAVILTVAGEATMIVPAGIMLTLFSQGDFWAEFPGGATPGQAVYADPSTGAPLAGAVSGANSAVVTAAAGASFTGVIATNVLTVSALTGYLTPGDILAGVGVTPGTVLGAQLTGTAGGTGTYTVVHGDLASVAMTTTSSVLVVSAVTSGVLGVGSSLSGSGVTAGTVVTAQLSGTPGGIGQYSISPVQRFASTAVSEAGIATGFKVNSVTKVPAVVTASIAATGVMTVTAVTSGVLEPGQLLSGTNVPHDARIISKISGTGGTGTYLTNVTGVVTSTTITARAGQLAKISSWG